MVRDAVLPGGVDAGCGSYWRQYANRHWQSEQQVRHMPTLFRFILVVSVLGAAGYGGLFLLATKFEPQPQEVTKPIGSVKIRKQ